MSWHKRLVFAQSITQNGDVTGKCPHCGELIVNVGNKVCSRCQHPIAWHSFELSFDEKQPENDGFTQHELEHNKRIKPCPFCGKSVAEPNIKIRDVERPYIYLEVACLNCEIALTCIVSNASIESIINANQELIKKWNTRWKDEPT